MQIALQIYFVVLVVLYCACEGSKQRFVPTGLATGDNEIEQHRNFSETHCEVQGLRKVNGNTLIILLEIIKKNIIIIK